MKKIDPEQFYTPKEISDMGIMTATSDDTRRQMILRHIRQGKLQAKNLGGDKKPRYVVLGRNLIDYKDRQVRPGDYMKK